MLRFRIDIKRNRNASGKIILFESILFGCKIIQTRCSFRWVLRSFRRIVNFLLTTFKLEHFSMTAVIIRLITFARCNDRSIHDLNARVNKPDTVFYIAIAA